jgi:hypothetical protein
MARRKVAHVFCVETPWNTDLRDRSSVRPLLEVLEAQSSVRFIHRDAATSEELEHYLKTWSQTRYKEYKLGYFPFHGDRDCLILGRRYYGLGEMQELLAGKLAGRTVYFSSCATLGIGSGLIEEFRVTTGATAVCGFTKSIDWMDGAVFDLALINAVSWYARPSDAFRYLAKNHDGAVKRLGFRAVWNGGSL